MHVVHSVNFAIVVGFGWFYLTLSLLCESLIFVESLSFACMGNLLKCVVNPMNEDNHPLVTDEPNEV